MPTASPPDSNLFLVIGFHADGNTAGGLATFIRCLSKGFQEKGHRVVLFVNRWGPFADEMSETCEVHTFNVDAIVNPGFKLGPVRVPNPIAAVKNSFAAWSKQNRVAQVIRQVSPDVILGNGMFSAALIGKSCQQSGVPLILAIHGIGRRGNDLLAMRAKISARFLNKASMVVGVSNACLERYKPYLRVPNKTIYSCCPPVQTKNLKPEFLYEHGLPPDTTIIGSFGRIQPDKGYHVLIRAAKRLEGINNLVIVIGGTPLCETEERYLADLQRLASELDMQDRCLFIGHVTPEHFFSVIDIFCHTYLGEEALGFVILEALSAACPVIAVDLGGPREILKDSSAGQLIAPNNPELLANAILKYIENPSYAKTAAENGLRHSRTNLNFEDWPIKWLNLIASCIQSNRP